MTSQKFTLSMPVELHEALKEQADKYDTSIKEVLRQCLKFGLTAMKIAEDPDGEIYFRERVTVGHDNGEPKQEIRESRVFFPW